MLHVPYGDKNHLKNSFFLEKDLECKIHPVVNDQLRYHNTNPTTLQSHREKYILKTLANHPRVCRVPYDEKKTHNVSHKKVQTNAPLIINDLLTNPSTKLIIIHFLGTKIYNVESTQQFMIT